MSARHLEGVGRKDPETGPQPSCGEEPLTVRAARSRGQGREEGLRRARGTLPLLIQDQRVGASAQGFWE